MTTVNRRGRCARVSTTIALVVLAMSLLTGRAGAETHVGPTPDDARVRLAAAPTAPADAARAVEMAPFILKTVPPVAGFPVTMDGVTARTDAAGRAHFIAPATHAPIEDRVTLTEATLPIDGQQVRVRVDHIYPDRTLALDLSYLVTFGFTGADGRAVDPSDLQDLTVRSETGEVVHVRPREPTWLQGSRVIKRFDVMDVKTLHWSVQKAQLSGSNLVNASQQVFVPAEKQSVDVRLAFFALDVHVQDAIYGLSYGGHLELTYPDGHARRFPLDADGRLSIRALPRGDYTLTILGPGPKMSRPLAVSRNQDVGLAFYSWSDIVTVLGVLIALFVGLLWIGRVRRQGRARRRGPVDVSRPRAGRLRLRRMGTASTGGRTEPVREPEQALNEAAGVSPVRRGQGRQVR